MNDCEQVMFGFTKQLSLNAVTVIALCGLLFKTDALYCRNGVDNSVGYVYYTKRCTESQPACFQSVKCSQIGDTYYRDYDWECIDKGQCSNVTGKSIAHYEGIKGMIQSPIVQSLCYALLGQTKPC